jgi:Lsr2
VIRLSWPRERAATQYDVFADEIQARGRVLRSPLQPAGLPDTTADVADKRPRRAGRTTASGQRSGDIRAWAKDHGIAVSERGRIPAGVIEQY